MEGVIALRGSMAITVINASVLLTVANMAHALTMGSVNVRTDTQALTAPQLYVMSNAAFMEVFVTMEFVSSAVRIMLAIHAKTVHC